MASGTHWVGGWMDPSTGLEAVPLQGIEPGFLGFKARSLRAIATELFRL
jgi:hypothetical protein